jgi:hypothetical protein
MTTVTSIETAADAVRRLWVNETGNCPTCGLTLMNTKNGVAKLDGLSQRLYESHLATCHGLRWDRGDWRQGERSER